MSCAAPLDHMRILLYAALEEEPEAETVFSGLTPDLADAVLEEAHRLARDVIGPAGKLAELEPPRYDAGRVLMPAASRDAYRTWREGGWNALAVPAKFGGQDLPWALAFLVQEMWQSADMGLGLCPLLNQGAIELLSRHGTEAQRALYLPRLVSGEWTGTMNLTEPQAGSDLGAIRTVALPRPDGSWSISGQKIFITFGEHDLTDNIIHLVLARTPDATSGSRGLSLFVVPKRLPDAEGRTGPLNDVECLGIERKLGIHSSPTCTMAYGLKGGATGWLIGEEGQGLALMFTMMNNARLAVGLQGVGIAERALQDAEAYASQRIQGLPLLPGGAIASHPDVRRMLLDMRASTQAARALAHRAAIAMDRATRHPNPEWRAAAQAEVDLLTPLVKAWATDTGVAVASTGIQVHGGTGYIESTGVARHLRDARIAPIYEGTNGIQAQDLVFRKILKDKGKASAALIADLRAEIGRLEDVELRHAMTLGVDALEETVAWVLRTGPADPAAVAAGAYPCLELFATVTASAALARARSSAIKAAAVGAVGESVMKSSDLALRHFVAGSLARALPLGRVAASIGATVCRID